VVVAPAKKKDALTIWTESQLSSVRGLDVAMIVPLLMGASTAQEVVEFVADNLSGTLSNTFNPRKFAEEFIQRRKATGKTLTGSYNVGLISLVSRRRRRTMDLKKS